MKKYRKTLAFFIAILMTLATLGFVGCGDGGDKNIDKEPVSITELGYLEDFGNELVRKSVLQDGKTKQDGEDEENYDLVEERADRKIFFSHLDMPQGAYSAQLGDLSIGKIEVSKTGEAYINSVPNGLIFGDYYELVCTTSYGKPYTQLVRYVSRTIDDGNEFMRMVNYYSRYIAYQTTCCDVDFNSSAPCEHTNPEKFYNGQTFSQRFYVFCGNIFVGRGQKWVGVGGIYYPDGIPQTDKDPYCNLENVEHYYFYDILDGQGYNIEIQEMGDGGLFGNIAQNAKVYNLSFNSSMLHAYSDGNGDWHMNKAPTKRGYIAYSIAQNAVIENVAVYNTMQINVINGVNGVAPYISAGATLRNIYVGLLSNLSVEHRNENDRYLSGMLGYGCDLYTVDNVVVVSPYVDFAFYKEEDGEMVKYTAENEAYDDYYVQGLSRYTTAEDAVNGGSSMVGNWQINANGTATFVG